MKTLGRLFLSTLVVVASLMPTTPASASPIDWRDEAIYMVVTDRFRNGDASNDLDSVPGKIFLIVDGHPVHKAKKVREFAENKTDGRLKIFFLPPYSPDLNPDEWVWNNVKNDRIGREVIMSKDDLKTKAIGALRRLQKLPHIVRGFFRDPKLAYILD